MPLLTEQLGRSKDLRDAAAMLWKSPRTIAACVVTGALLGVLYAWWQEAPQATVSLRPHESAMDVLPPPNCEGLTGERALQCQADHEIWVEALDPYVIYVQAISALRSRTFIRQFHKTHRRDRELRLRRSYRTAAEFQEHLILHPESTRPSQLHHTLALSGYAPPNRAPHVLAQFVHDLHYAAVERTLRGMDDLYAERSRIARASTQAESAAHVRRQQQALVTLQKRMYSEMPRTFVVQPTQGDDHTGWLSSATAGVIFGLLAGILAAALRTRLPQPQRWPGEGS